MAEKEINLCVRALAELSIINALAVRVIKRKMKVFDFDNLSAAMMLKYKESYRESMYMNMWKLEGSGPLAPFKVTKIVLPRHRRN